MTRPPRWSRGLLALLLPARTRDAVLDDLDALWRTRHEAEGPRRASRWYRRQVRSALVPTLRARIGRSVPAGVAALRQDLGFAWTQLGRHPGVGALVVATLALGTGATTAIFSTVHGALLRPLPYEDPASLVMVTAAAGQSDEVRFLSAPDALGLADEVPSVAEVGLFGETTVGPLTGIDRPEHVKVGMLSWNALRVLGIETARGRTFVENDAVAPTEDRAAPAAAVMDHGLWMRAFGGDPEVVGRRIEVWGAPTIVVGVLPEAFRLHLPPVFNLGSDVDLWVAFRGELRDWNRDHDWLRAVARLRPGVGPAEARRAADTYAADLRARHPRHAQEETRLDLTPLTEAVTSEVRAPVLVLFGAVTLVLLIACGNAASLLLARGAAREGEMAVRGSLGAGATRLVRQLLTEAAVFALLGAGGGALLAFGGVRLLHLLRPPDLARFEGVTLDLPVLGFAILLAAATALLAGLLPALQAARMASPAGVLRRRGGGVVARRAREGLVIAQVALSVVLLAGAALLVRTFTELQAVPLGFDPDRVLTVTATQTIRPATERQAYETELVRAARAVPGVADAGIVFPLPMNGVYERSAEYVPDASLSDPTAWRRVYYRTVSPTYFRTMGLDVVRGRGFTAADEEGDATVVVLDERIARTVFGRDDPVGRYVHVRGMAPDTLRARVVGVAEWTPQWDHRDTRPTLYFPRAFYRSHEVSLVARIEGDPARVAPALAAAVRGVDARFPSDLVPMSRYVGDRLARARFLLVLMQLFAAVALGLTATGLYGVVSYAVRRRTRELGVRRALGAPAGTLTGEVVVGGVRIAILGVLGGVILTLLLAGRLDDQLFGVGPFDLRSISWTALVVLAVAILASLAPALRAGRVEPAVALREE